MFGRPHVIKVVCASGETLDVSTITTGGRFETIVFGPDEEQFYGIFDAGGVSYVRSCGPDIAAEVGQLTLRQMQDRKAVKRYLAETED